MTGLIDRVEAASMLESGRTYKTSEVRDLLNRTTDIEATPTKPGRWETLLQICNGYGVMHYYHKECKIGNGQTALHGSPYPYCPHCGSIMVKNKE